MPASTLSVRFCNRPFGLGCSRSGVPRERFLLTGVEISIFETWQLQIFTDTVLGKR